MAKQTAAALKIGDPIFIEGLDKWGRPERTAYKVCHKAPKFITVAPMSDAQQGGKSYIGTGALIERIPTGWLLTPFYNGEEQI